MRSQESYQAAQQAGSETELCAAGCCLGCDAQMAGQEVFCSLQASACWVWGVMVVWDVTIRCVHSRSAYIVARSSDSRPSTLYTCAMDSSAKAAKMQLDCCRLIPCCGDIHVSRTSLHPLTCGCCKMTTVCQCSAEQHSYSCSWQPT